MPRYPSHQRLQGLISFCRICSWWIVLTTNLTYAFSTFCNSIYPDIWQRLYSNWCLDIMLDPSHQRLHGLISFCRVCSWWIVMATNLAYAFNTFCNSMYPDIWQRLYSNWCLDIILDPRHQRLQGLISFCRIYSWWIVMTTNQTYVFNMFCNSIYPIFDKDFTVTDASISYWIQAISGYKVLSVFVGFVLGE